MKVKAFSLRLMLALVVLAGFLVPLRAQGQGQITAEARQEVDRLLADYQRAVDDELQSSGVKVLTGEAARRMDLLWEETQTKVEEIIARPGAEREPVSRMIEQIEGESPTYLRRWHFPYNPAAELERYQTDRHVYTVEIDTSQVVEIIPVDSAYRVEAIYSEAELQEKAQDFVRNVARSLDLDALRLSIGTKGGQTFFFRWEDASRVLPDDTVPFVQVGFSAAGDFLNYVNTLPVSKIKVGRLTAFNTALPADRQFAITAFNEIYANGSTQYWRQSGSFLTTNNAGYCYTQGTWCTPKNFYWQYTYPSAGNPVNIGRWRPNVTSQFVSVYAYIPSTNATAKVKYRITWNNGAANAWSSEINQNSWFNTWVTVNGGSYHSITEIYMSNGYDTRANYRVAWDEIWLYRP